MSQDVQTFLAELAEAGSSEFGGGFTLRSDKAREKLQKFALAHPENYFLLIVAGLVALGGRRFTLRVDADDLEVTADCGVKRRWLTHLWEYVAGAQSAPETGGLRLLGLAILTSVRFDKVEWNISSQDEEGGFCWIQRVRSGDLPEPCISEQTNPDRSVAIRVKRKSFKQVAGRFLTQWANRLFSNLWEEHRLINERVFLGELESFTVNGTTLDYQMAGARSLALLRVGDAGRYLRAQQEFQRDGSPPLTVLLTYPPDTDSELPGSPGCITWLWHGLRMGESSLGLPYEFCRVFIRADELPTDLSFTSVADTWQRQKAERSAREAVHHLLEQVLSRWEEQSEPSRDLLEAYLLRVAVHRIDSKRNRRRLASFNRALIACPLLLGSASDGIEKRWSLEDVWSRLEVGEKVACFPTAELDRAVPAWPDRPLVVRERSGARAVLKKIFGEEHLLDADALGRRLEGLSAVERSEQAPGRYRPEPLHPHVQGTIVFGKNPLHWFLEFPAAGSQNRPGRVEVIRNGVLYFKDSTLAVPSNFCFYGEQPWEPNYRGFLADDQVRRELTESAARALVDYLEACSTPPLEPEVGIAQEVWRLLSGTLTLQASGSSLLERRWAPIRDELGEAGWAEPQSLFTEVSLKEQPLFYACWEDLEKLRDLRAAPRALILDSQRAEMLASKLPQPGLVNLRGIQLLRQRPPYEPDPAHFKVVEVDPGLWGEPRIERVRVGFPYQKIEAPPGEDGRIELHTNLSGSEMQMRRLSTFVGPAVVCLDWNQGWPDSRGRHFADKRQTETTGTLLAPILSAASRTLLTESAWEELVELEPATLGSAWLDAWTESAGREPLFLLADGTRTTLRELRERDSVLYLVGSRPAPDGWERALRVPQAVAQELPALAEEINWLGSDLGSEKSQETGEPALQPIRETSPVITSSPATRPGVVSPPPSRIAQPAFPASTDGEPALGGPLSKLPQPPAEEKPVVLTADSNRVEGDVARLVAELAELKNLGEVPCDREFTQFLLALHSDTELDQVLTVREQRVSLRRLHLASRPPDAALALLSALFSLFNRLRPEVGDTEERAFHHLLLERGRRLPGKGPTASGD